MEEKKDEKNSKKSDKKELGNAEEEEATEEMDVLKKRISSHPLYGLLLEAHLNCLKVCSGEDSPELDTEEAITLFNKVSLHSNSSPPPSPELDSFMEAYCRTLRELQEAMEKPLQETDRFLGSMYSQLNDIVRSPP